MTDGDKSADDGAGSKTPTAQERDGAAARAAAPAPMSKPGFSKPAAALASGLVRAVSEYSLTGEYVLGGEWSVDPHASDEESRAQRSASVALARDLVAEVSAYLQVDVDVGRRDRLIRWVLTGHITPQQAADALVRGPGSSPDLAELLALVADGATTEPRQQPGA